MRRRFGGKGLDALTRAGERVRKASVVPRKTAQARAKVLVRHKSARALGAMKQQQAVDRARAESGYEVRKARLYLYRRTLPMLAMLAWLIPGDGGPRPFAALIASPPLVPAARLPDSPPDNVVDDAAANATISAPPSDGFEDGYPLDLGNAR